MAFKFAAASGCESSKVSKYHKSESQNRKEAGLLRTGALVVHVPYNSIPSDLWQCSGLPVHADKENYNPAGAHTMRLQPQS